MERADNMDDPRDVQTAERNGSSGSVLSAGSAVAMEIKRKKIRQSALLLQTEVCVKKWRVVLCVFRRQHGVTVTVRLTLGGRSKSMDTNVNQQICGCF